MVLGFLLWDGDTNFADARALPPPCADALYAREVARSSAVAASCRKRRRGSSPPIRVGASNQCSLGLVRVLLRLAPVDLEATMPSMSWTELSGIHALRSAAVGVRCITARSSHARLASSRTFRSSFAPLGPPHCPPAPLEDSLRSDEHGPLVPRFPAMFIRLTRPSQARTFHATGGCQSSGILPAVFEPTPFLARRGCAVGCAHLVGIQPKRLRGVVPRRANALKLRAGLRWRVQRVPTGVVNHSLRSPHRTQTPDAKV